MLPALCWYDIITESSAHNAATDDSLGGRAPGSQKCLGSTNTGGHGMDIQRALSYYKRYVSVTQPQRALRTMPQLMTPWAGGHQAARSAWAAQTLVAMEWTSRERYHITSAMLV